MSVNAQIVGNAVDDIIDDIRGRKGLGDLWDELDIETHVEIRARWEEIVAGAIASAQSARDNNPATVPTHLPCE